MTVADLIKLLEVENPDREIVVYDYSTQDEYPVIGIYFDSFTGKVVIES